LIKAQMKVHHALMIVLSATCLSSCLPLPVHYHTRPDIYGTVARNGVPLEGAKIGYSDDPGDSHCDSYPTKAVSASNGAFHIDGTYSFFHVIYLEPHAPDSVSGRICVETSDGQHFTKDLIMNGGNGVGSIPDNASVDQLVIDCDLAKDTCAGKAQ
jgi:hypothetical protein